MENCVFCKIIKGEIPCHKIYEDDLATAFLDIFPTSPGHILVVPKKHCEGLLDVDEETLGGTMAVVRKVALAVQKGLGCGGFNVIQNNGAAAGQVVPHLHFHIIPRSIGDGLVHWSGKQYENGEAEACMTKIVGALN